MRTATGSISCGIFLAVELKNSGISKLLSSSVDCLTLSFCFIESNLAAES